MLVKDRLLQILLDSPIPLTFRDIEAQYGLNAHTVRGRLRLMRQAGLLEARKTKHYSRKGCVPWEFFIPGRFEADPDEPTKEPPDESTKEPPHDTFIEDRRKTDKMSGDALVDAAILRSKPRWRSGELFTRKEVEMFREEHMRRRRYVLLGQ